MRGFAERSDGVFAHRHLDRCFVTRAVVADLQLEGVIELALQFLRDSAELYDISGSSSIRSASFPAGGVSVLSRSSSAWVLRCVSVSSAKRRWID
jgi:hypothetical protein